MSGKENADNLRKQLGNVEKRISKLANERMALMSQISKIEQGCMHNWSNTELIKGTKDQYQRTCHNCGMIQKSKAVQVKF